MRYLNRRGDIDITSETGSVCIFDNRKDIVAKFGYVVPTYKRASLLRFALNSILGQIGQTDCEILVVDDCPIRDDETEKLMSSEYDKPGIAYFKNCSNLQQAGNWNKLFALSRPEWVIMLQDDDMLYPDFFKYLNVCMSKYPDNIRAFFPCVVSYQFDDDVLPSRKNEQIRARLIHEFDFLQGCVLGAGALGMCIRKDAIEEIGGVNISAGVAVDYDFYARLSRVTTIVKMYGYPLGVWRTMVNVSQKLSTVQFCIEWGDILKWDTLEDLKMTWLSPLYKLYVKGFDNQHLKQWYKVFAKDKVESDTNTGCLTELVYKLWRIFFSSVRKIRKGKFNLIVD